MSISAEEQEVKKVIKMNDKDQQKYYISQNTKLVSI